MRREKITNFEEARRCLKNLFCNTTSWKKRPCIVETRTKDLDQEVTYKALLQDLYLSHLEDDPRDRRSYQEQLEEFREWYSKLPQNLDHYLVERLILREGYATISQDEAEELRKKYFEKPVKISVIKMS